MRACVLCLLLVLAGCGTLKNGPGPEYPTLNKDEEQFAKALAHYCQGLIYEKELGWNSPEALEQFARAAELDSARDKLYLRTALACLRQEFSDKAAETLEESCPNHIDLAVKHYSQAVKLTPASTFSYLALAGLLFQQNKDSRAIKILKKGLRKADSSASIMTFCYNMGARFINNGEISRSIPCFQLIARRGPSQRRRFYHLLGKLYEGLGYKEEAVRNFTMATRENSPLPDSFIKLALIYLKFDSSKAIETLICADQRLPDNPLILSLLGYIYRSKKQFKEAVSVFEQIMEVVEESEEQKFTANFYLLYGDTCQRAGQIEKAEEIFEKCLEHYPDAHNVLNYLAYMWAEKGIKLEKGLEYITRALEFEPGSGAYVDTLGWIYYKQKRYREALEQIQKANRLIENDPTITDHLGDVFDALKDTGKALSYWKQSFLLDPENKTVAEKLEAHGINLDELRKEVKQNKIIEQK